MPSGFSSVTVAPGSSVSTIVVPFGVSWWRAIPLTPARASMKRVSDDPVLTVMRTVFGDVDTNPVGSVSTTSKSPPAIPLTLMFGELTAAPTEVRDPLAPIRKTSSRGAVRNGSPVSKTPSRSRSSRTSAEIVTVAMSIRRSVLATRSTAVPATSVMPVVATIVPGQCRPGMVPCTAPDSPLESPSMRMVRTSPSALRVHAASISPLPVTTVPVQARAYEPPSPSVTRTTLSARPVSIAVSNVSAISSPASDMPAMPVEIVTRASVIRGPPGRVTVTGMMASDRLFPSFDSASCAFESVWRMK